MKLIFATYIGQQSAVAFKNDCISKFHCDSASYRQVGQKRHFRLTYAIELLIAVNLNCEKGSRTKLRLRSLRDNQKLEATDQLQSFH